MEVKKVVDEIRDMMEVIKNQIEELDNLFSKYEIKQVKLMREDPRELWRSIDCYANYEVSTQGRVRNATTDRILKPGTNLQGYLFVILSKNGIKKIHYIHRLVAQEFLENSLELECVDHIDHNPKNNCVFNLRFCTPSENQMNRKKQENTSSKFKGVYFNKTSKKWMAYIKKDGRMKNLGYFENEIDAARAYNKKATELFKEFKLLNEIPEDES